MKCSFLNKLKFLGSKGQTAVEYLLLMSVVITMMFTIMGKVKAWFLSDTGTCTSGKFSFVCVAKGVFGKDATFQTFKLMKR